MAAKPETLTRDYLAAMAELIEKRIPKGDFIPAIEGDKLYEWLEKNDPDLYIGWAWEIGRVLLGEEFRRRMQKKRALTTENARHGGQRRITKAFWDMSYEVNAEHTQRPLKNMTKDDLLYAAESYSKRAFANELQAEFLRVIAKKVGNKTVEEVYTEEQIRKMYDSVFTS